MYNIYVVEGPAGAGKSTWIKKQLMNTNSFEALRTPFSPSRFPTDYPDTLTMMSVSNDLNKLLAALEIIRILHMNTVHDMDYNIYVDRGFLSEHIYGMIRRKDQALVSLPSPLSVLDQMDRALNLLLHELTDRSLPGTYPPLSEVSIYLALILPPSEQDLLSRRRLCGKEYPAGLADYHLYLEFAQQGRAVNPDMDHYKAEVSYDLP